MNIDPSIVNGYLSADDGYAQHWLFHHILDNGEYAFDKPDPARREMVRGGLAEIQRALDGFVPYNLELFSALFPRWEELLRDVNVILSVGCPAPYDAMVREHDGKEYMIFDLIRLLDYQRAGESAAALIRQFVTHEASHVCLHADYPAQPTAYRERLGYIAFDEGFAHALAFSDGIGACAFGPMIREHYQNSVEQLRAALLETDPRRQERLLEASNCGPYWDKFAAVSGKLYILSHLNRIYEIYRRGPSELLSHILREPVHS